MSDLPGKDGKTFKITLNKEWFDKRVDIIKPHYKWYNLLLKWLTFGFYNKPTGYKTNVKHNSEGGWG